ncbi:hypothetical protein Tco_0716963 [Tanacetum coccineum]
MATAAFKSNSKRSSNDKASSPKSNPNNKPENPKQKQRLRRSLSVSAVSRTTTTTCEEEFLNKRDNPLYWGSPEEADNKKNNNNTSEESKVVVVLQNVAQRGRSVVRNSGGQMEIGRRGRSVSRPRFPQAIRRNTSATLVSIEVTDASKLVKPGAVRLVLGIRREYAKRTEECEEIQLVEVNILMRGGKLVMFKAFLEFRTGKLVILVESLKFKKIEHQVNSTSNLKTCWGKPRSDLAIENIVSRRLGRILKENLPENPIHLALIGSRGRKYAKLCECVSISAFDSSDFSAAEDPACELTSNTSDKGCYFLWSKPLH